MEKSTESIGCFTLLFIILLHIFITYHKQIHEEVECQFKRHFQCHKNKMPHFLGNSDTVREL